MQNRHIDRQKYFDELATTTRKYILPYIASYIRFESQLRVLELGCGDGGNLLPFAEQGCSVVGLDICEGRINTAKQNFKDTSYDFRFYVPDICNLLDDEYGCFDIIICHDVIEHIERKSVVLESISRMLVKDELCNFVSTTCFYILAHE